MWIINSRNHKTTQISYKSRMKKDAKYKWRVLALLIEIDLVMVVATCDLLEEAGTKRIVFLKKKIVQHGKKIHI